MIGMLMIGEGNIAVIAFGSPITNFAAPEKKVKEKLHEIIDKFYKRSDFKTIRIVIDVDPL